ncbi:MAG: AsmA family protein [Magnetococcales bacterium]|nr:AsmA family protein [Magnetococcales bacterium]
MIRILIGLIIAFATVLFLVLTALVVVPIVVDQDDYKEQIVNLVKEKTGHDIVLYGDISLSMNQISQITVSLGRSEIKNSHGISGGSLAVVDSIDLGLELLPLFSKKFEVTYLSAIGLEANLERSVSGLGNWQGSNNVAKSDETGSQQEPQQNSEQETDKKISNGKKGLAFLAGFSLGDIIIKNAKVNYVDHGSGAFYSVDKLNINSNEIKPGQISKISMRGQWQGQNPASEGDLNLTYNFLFAPSANRVEVTGLSMEFNGKRSGFTIKESELALKTDMVYDLSEGSLKLNRTDIALKVWTQGLAFRELGLNFRGAVTVAPDFTSLHLPNAAMTTQIKADTLPPAGVELAIQSDISFNLLNSVVKMEKLSVKGPANMLLSGSVVGESLRSSPQFSGALVLDEFEVQALLNALGRPLTEAGQLRHAALASKFKITAARGELEHFTLKLDDTNIKGVVAIDSFAKPVVGFDVAVDNLDLNRYLASKKSGNLTQNNVASQIVDNGAVESDSTPVQLIQVSSKPQSASLTFLDNLNLYGRAAFANLKVGKLVVKDLKLETTANRGLVTLAPVTAKLYGGQLLANLDLDTTKSQPHIKIASQINGLKAENLLADLTGDSKFSGLSNLTLKATSLGVDAGAIRKNLNGTMALEVEDGELHGVDLVDQIRTIYKTVSNSAKDDTATDDMVGKATSFSTLSATATIKNGVIYNSDLALGSEILLVNGGGTVDLVAEEVDYTFNADVYTTVKELNQKEAEKIKGLLIPIHLKGKFDSIGPPQIEDSDLSVILGSALKTKLVKDGLEKLRKNDKVRKEIDRLEDKFGGKLPVKKLLDGLFGM